MSRYHLHLVGAQAHRSEKKNLMNPNFEKNSPAAQFISGANWGFKNQGHKEKD
jgi:hypothetical protein